MNVVFILFFIGYLLACISIGGWSQGKGRGFAAGFFVSLFFSPVVGLVVVAILSENKSTSEERSLSSGEMKKCPKCAELIKVDAKRCRYCGNEDFPD
jgi:hypothetical protein